MLSAPLFKASLQLPLRFLLVLLHRLWTALGRATSAVQCHLLLPVNASFLMLLAYLILHFYVHPPLVLLFILCSPRSCCCCFTHCGQPEAGLPVRWTRSLSIAPCQWPPPSAAAQIVDSLKKGYQCMVFVHSRKDTGKTARQLADLAGKNGDTALFDTRDHDKYTLYQKDVSKSRCGETGRCVMAKLVCSQRRGQGGWCCLVQGIMTSTRCTRRTSASPGGDGVEGGVHEGAGKQHC